MARNVHRERGGGPVSGPATPRWPRPAAALLLAGWAGMATWAAIAKNVTLDESVHLPAGFSYLVWKDFRLNPEHPPLVKALAALPAVALGVRAPAQDPDTWGRALFDPTAEWRFGHDFLFANPAVRPDRVLRLGRLMIVGLGLLGGALLFLWARELYDERVAVGVLALYALDPTVIAHGALVTTDVAITTFILGASYFLWRVAARATIGNTAGLVVFFALAQVSKFTGVLLAPIACLVLALRAVGPDAWPASWRDRTWIGATRARRMVQAAVVIIAIAVASWIAVWAAYCFRFSPTPDGRDHFPVRAESSGLGVAAEVRDDWRAALIARASRFALDHHVLPEAYLYGLTSVMKSESLRTCYLMGELKQGSWWYYFPVAMAVKLPVATLAVIALGLVLAVRRLRWVRAAEQLPPLLVPPLVYFAFAVGSAMNIGVRHVLPVYPFLFLLAGCAIAVWLDSRRAVTRWAGWGLAIWLVVSSVSIAPHFLAYFNDAAGGPKNGPRWLMDSNIDWGQDLVTLKRWMGDHNVGWINLAYWGAADPDYYGLRYVRLPGMSSPADRPTSAPRAPGLLAISVNNLYGAYPTMRTLYRQWLANATLVDRVGYSIYVYRLP